MGMFYRQPNSIWESQHFLSKLTSIKKLWRQLKELGINIKNKESMGNFIVAKSTYLFTPVDEEGNPVDIAMMGNGTKCHAVISSYRHKMSAKFGAAPSIKKLIVTELKVYVPEGAEEEETADDIL